jgi:hypothetical protein
MAGRRHPQVIQDSQVAEHPVTFGYHGHTGSTNHFRAAVMQSLAPGNDGARQNRERTRDRHHRARFAGTVGADERRNLSRRNVQIDAMEHGFAAAMNDKVSNGQHACFLIGSQVPR